ncbi:MAG: DUF1287 domain-containing protein [Hyphomonadaceae bacterium]
MRRRDLTGALLAGLALGSFGGAPFAQAQQADQEADTPLPMKLVAGARAQIGVTTIYDPAYVRLDYPMGDVPIERGVCSDVVVRAFRSGGVDLQQVMHEDMRAHFSAYPKIWGLKRPDRNIDHRRVPNLEVFFARKGGEAPVTSSPDDYLPGDIVTWRLTGSGLPHCGVVSDRRRGGEPLVVHNIGAGAQEENVLFAWTQTRHFRFEAWA